ncbi:MAG: insulinase family protein [Caulobacter sp.]
MGAALLSGPALGEEPAKAPAVQSNENKATAAQKAIDPTIAPDPAIRQGVLPNGMRYLVMRNAAPSGAVSLRLAVDVGSLEESDAERGSAHFVEHMAFRSTRRYPEGGPDRVFAPWGVVFGRDQNAVTDYFSTAYMLDMPKPDDAQLKTGVGWLRDVADGVIFTDDGVGRERGVVLAEMETRGGAQLDAQIAISRFQAPELRSVERLPIGTRKALDAATPASLRRFYDAWYRPEHAVVTVVGDRPVEALEALVRDTFSDWRGRGPKPVRAPVSALRAKRALDGLSIAHENLPTAITACSLRPGAPPQIDTVAVQRREIMSDVWQTILNQRLARRVSSGETHLLGAGAFDLQSREQSMTCLVAMPTNDSWEAGLAETQAEFNRLAKTPATDVEFENAVEKLRSMVRGASSNAASRKSPDLASGLLAKALAGQVARSPADAFYVFNRAVEDATVDDMRAAFVEDWSGTGPLVSITGPAPPPREALLAAWTRNGDKVSDELVDKPFSNATWAYGDFGPAGQVVRRETIADPGFVRLYFANGLVMNFKQTDVQPNKVEVRLTFGAGRREIADKDNTVAEFGLAMMSSGGLGKHSAEDLEAMFPTGGLLNFETNLGVTAFSIDASIFGDTLARELEILAAFMTDPGFRGTLDARLPTAADLAYRSMRSLPPSALSDAMAKAFDPSGTSSLPPLDKLSAIRASDFVRVLKPVLVTAPIELTVAGDIDEASAIRAAARTFGALPARPTADRKRSDIHFLTYPDNPAPPIRVEHAGPSDKAAVALIWPLYVASPERRKEEYALKLLASVFDTALRRRIREELGKTYAPNVGTHTPDHGDQGVLEVSIEADPRDVATLAVEAEAVAARLRAGEITEQMLTDARQPVLAMIRANRETTSWWADAMAGSAADPAILEESLLVEPLITSVTVEDLRAAARTWLKRPPLVGFAYPSANAKTAEVSTGAAR